MHKAAISWVKRGLGNPDLLIQFDADYNPYAKAPFNSGIFASRRGAITEDTLKELHEKEVAFYKDILKKKFTWRYSEVFYTDQGRLNYLVSKLHLSLQDLRPDGHDSWAGDITERVTVDSIAFPSFDGCIHIFIALMTTENMKAFLRSRGMHCGDTSKSEVSTRCVLRINYYLVFVTCVD
jgi:hypothetical protein